MTPVRVRECAKKHIPLWAKRLVPPVGFALSSSLAFGAAPWGHAPPRAAANPADQKAQVTVAPKGSWTVALPGNIQIRLLGVTAGPSAVGPWWTPDGAPLAESPYPEETAAERTLRPSDYALFGGKPGERPYFFAYEVTQPASADVHAINANALEPTIDGRTARIRLRCLAFLAPSKRRGAATLSLASAPWQTIARSKSTGGYFSGKDRQNVPFDFHLMASVLPIRVDSTPSGEVVEVEWSGHFGGANPWQIVVVDRHGDPMEQVVGGAVRPTDNYHIEFRPHGIENPKLDMIKEIRVQVRPEQEIVFEDVALQRAAKKAAK